MTTVTSTREWALACLDAPGHQKQQLLNASSKEADIKHASACACLCPYYCCCASVPVSLSLQCPRCCPAAVWRLCCSASCLLQLTGEAGYLSLQQYMQHAWCCCFNRQQTGLIADTVRLCTQLRVLCCCVWCLVHVLPAAAAAVWGLQRLHLLAVQLQVACCCERCLTCSFSIAASWSLTLRSLKVSIPSSCSSKQQHHRAQSTVPCFHPRKD